MPVSPVQVRVRPFRRVRGDDHRTHSCSNSELRSVNRLTGSDNRIGYDGYVYNPQSRTYLVRNRTYNPRLGRWQQRDPAGYVDGMNLYEYVRSMPHAGTDPLGKESWVMDKQDHNYFRTLLNRLCPEGPNDNLRERAVHNRTHLGSCALPHVFIYVAFALLATLTTSCSESSETSEPEWVAINRQKAIRESEQRGISRQNSYVIVVEFRATDRQDARILGRGWLVLQDVDQDNDFLYDGMYAVEFHARNNIKYFSDVIGDVNHSRSTIGGTKHMELPHPDGIHILRLAIHISDKPEWTLYREDDAIESGPAAVWHEDFEQDR